MKKILFAAAFALTAVSCAVDDYTGEWAEYKKIEASIAEPSFPDVDYSIADCGAVPSDSLDARPAILKAIRLCSDNGGGRVVIPAGKYFVKGPVTLLSNVNLHFEDGAELLFSSDEKDYLPVVLTRWEGTEVFNYSPLIYAYCVKNIAITGKGVINGNGKANFEQWKAIQKPDQKALRAMGRDLVPVCERVFGEGHYLRPAMMDLISCSQILLEDVKIVDGTFWSFHLSCCDNATVRRCSVDCLNFNSDGVDPESSRNVLIEDCYFHTGDDGIAIKSGRDQDGWRVGQPTENVIVRNCTFVSDRANGMCIGSEISGGVRNVFVENINIISAKQGLYFKSNLDRGGYIENIYVRNVKMGRIFDSAIKFEPDYKSESKENYPTLMRNFHITDVQCDTAEIRGIYARGFAELPLQNIRIENMTIGYTPLAAVVEHTENFSVSLVEINGQEFTAE